jgi:N-6 DNA Methylase
LRAEQGHDLPDFSFYDSPGEFLVVCGEVKLPDTEVREVAFSEERNNQIGRYLAQTGVVVVCTIRGFGLVTIKPGISRQLRVPASDRVLERVVELWQSRTALVDGREVSANTLLELAELIETAVTRYAAIAEPESLAKILARQAKQAKQDLPAQFSQAVAGLAEDFGKALGVTFEGPEGEEFFRSSLIQTVFYGLFAGWTLWVRSGREKQFQWQDLGEYLKIPFLGELFYEFRHPRRIHELGLKKHLNLATETLSRVDIDAFFSRFPPPSLEHTAPDTSAAIVYFYEPFLEAFDPVLRKELGVWYTPVEVVRYQVEKVDRLLREQLGCEGGFADERVVALDPCCGTGAYLLEIMRCVANQLRAEGIGDLLGATLLEVITRRVLGFEILTAPFVISHLQIYLILAELGVEPPHSHRPAVFLTNALTAGMGRSSSNCIFQSSRKSTMPQRR